MNLYISTYLASYRLDLCERLSRDHGFAIYHYMGDEVPADVKPFWEEYTFENNRLPVKTLFGKYYAVGLKDLLARLRPSVVFIQEFSLITIQLLLLRRKFGFRVVSICDDNVDMIAGNDYARLHRLARPWIPRFLDDVLLTTPEAVAWYQSRFGKGRLLPLLPDEEKYRERLKGVIPEAVRFRQEVGAEGKRLILFVGRLVPFKNVPVLLEAFPPLKEEACLVIVGKGPMGEECRQKAGENVHFTGALYGRDVLACYQAADVMVLPSYLEAYGAVVGEALLAGCPAVVSEKCGSRSLIREGRNGRVVPPFDPSALTAALQSVFSDFPAHDGSVLRKSLCEDSFDRSFRQMMEDLAL